MGKLYDMAAAVQKAVDSSGKDPVKTKGSIGLQAGFFLAMIKPDTPDDPVKIEKLRVAAKTVLGVNL